MSSMRQALFVLSFCAAGLVVRFIILQNASLSKALGNRIEISTPLTAWKRAVEGVTLKKQGTSPYDGDIFHETPLALLLYEYFLSYAEKWIPAIFTISDLLTAIMLSLAARIYVCDVRCREKGVYPPSAASLLLKAENAEWVPFYVASVYLLCPYAIISCGGKSTVVFQNLILSLFIVLTCAGYWCLASVFLALLSYHSFYHINLIVPLLMYQYQAKGASWQRLMATTLVFLISLVLLLGISFRVTASWQFLWSTYGCILGVPDLSPNIGLFWYFFTEMFEHFRAFFVCTFQLNVFVYTAPLAIRLARDPLLLLLVQLILTAIFKSYPCLGDVSLYFALLPVWSHLFHVMRQRFVVSCVLAVCSLLAPTLWHLWIYSGSANANFYFAVTLVFNTGQIFLLTDVLSAFIKREYYLQNGVKWSADGQQVPLRLR